MESLGYIVGFIFSLIVFLIKYLLQSIFRIFGIRLFKEVKAAPIVQEQFDKLTEKKDSFKIGEEFEKYVREKVFTKDRYALIERTHNAKTNGEDFVESSLKPDFKFRNKKTRKEFYVEAKFRSKLYMGKLEFCKQKQLERYKSYTKECPVYIIVGFGGESSNPQQLYIEDVNKLEFPAIYEYKLKELDLQSNLPKLKV